MAFPDVSVLEVTVESTLVEELRETATITEEVESTLFDIDGAALEVIVEGVQGPSGTGGSAPAIDYQTRFDVLDGDQIIYRGWSLPGTAENLPAWKIQKITIVNDGESVIKQWAGGTESLAHAWSNRSSLEYA